jgi:hypothetical protein
MAEIELERYRHRDPPFEIDLPVGMEVGAMPGVLVVAREPAGARSPFASNLTVVAQDLPVGLDLAAHADESLAEEARSLPHWRLIDRAPAHVGELDAERTLATYRLSRASGVDFGRELSVAVEQWRIDVERRVWIVSASAESGDYGLVSDVWTTCAESLRPGMRSA